MSRFLQKIKSLFGASPDPQPEQSIPLVSPDSPPIESPPQPTITPSVSQVAQSTTVPPVNSVTQPTTVPPVSPVTQPTTAPPVDPVTQPTTAPPVSPVAQSNPALWTHTSSSGQPTTVQTFTVPPVHSFKEHTMLSKLAQALKDFPDLQSLAQQLQVLSQTHTLTRSQVEPLLIAFSDYITTQKSTLERLQTNLAEQQALASPLTTLCQLCSSIHAHPLSEDAITHENFLDHPTFTLLKLEIDFCHELTQHAHLLQLAPEQVAQFGELAKVSSSILEKVGSLVPPIQQFKSTETALREEIVNFSTVINKLQSQSNLSADWNGKKDALTQKREELATRRERYTEDENKINQAITIVTQNIPAISQNLKGVASNLLPLVQQQVASTPPAPSSQALETQIAQLTTLLPKLSTLLTEFTTYMHSLQ